MARPTTQDLSAIVDVVVEVSPASAPRPSFNELLILGPSTVISAETRLVSFVSADEILEYGFDANDPEYKAALLYFGQSPAPAKVWLGRQDLTTSPAESILDALKACRNADNSWYYCMATEAVDADHEEIAEWIQTAAPSSIYCYTTASAGALAGTTSPANIFTYMKNNLFQRVIGQYSTDDTNAIAAIIGYACGQNTGLSNSAFTLMFKREIGVTAEALYSNDITTIEGNNGNVYVNYGNYYNVFRPGKMGDGSFFDQILFRDMLVNYIQLNVMDLLYQNPKIPQTEAGVAQLMHAVCQANDQMVNLGYIGPGIWRGNAVLNLKNGDPMPKGYVVQAETVAAQSNADRAARKSPPIYDCINEAGAVHSVLIGVYVAV